MKQTEIGMIPDDWEVKKFKSITTRITVGIANSATHAYSDKGIIMFRNQNIKENKLDLSDLIYIKKEFALKYINKQIEAEDLLIARTGYPGTTCVVPNKFAGSQTFTTLIASPKKDEINSDYCAYFFNSNVGKKLFSAAQIGGAQKNVNAHTLSNILLPLPPTLAEQQKIAKALNDVDNVITTLEKLITKKKNIKQGTMQQLLTGKKRLPGFAPAVVEPVDPPAFKQTEIGEIPENWEVVKIKSFAKVFDGTHQTPNYVDVGIPFYSVENVTADDFEHTKYITQQEHKLLSLRVKIEKGDILMTRIGSIGDCRYVDWEPNASFYVSLALIKCNNKVDPRYISYYSNSEQFHKELELRSLFYAIPQKINLGPISEITICMPEKKEQTAIANFISDMDKEIKELCLKLEKYQNLKIGMMQQLLTGKIRLI